VTPSDVLSADRYIDEITNAAGRLADVLDGVPLDVHVPTCPSWVVRDLVVHVGGIHRWAARIVSERRTERAFMNLDDHGGPPEDNKLYAWFDEGVALLINALADAPEDLECFTFIEAPTAKLHWARRQAHETAIHRADAEAVALATTGFSLDFATDGLDEVLVGFWQRPGRGPQADRPTTVSITPLDVTSKWTASFGADGYSVVRDAKGADARVSGKASDLYVWAWKRPAMGQLVVDGDPAAVGRLLGDG